MEDYFESTILRASCAAGILNTEVIQTLWKGYGKIIRVSLSGAERKSVVVKQVRLPKLNRATGAGQKDLSHARKVKSYRVELNWYEKWAGHCDRFCRVPLCLAAETRGDEVLLVLEDLDVGGFGRRVLSPSWPEICAGLAWLAEFHATFMGKPTEGLWKVGTYWHLDTRPDELKALADSSLRKAAGLIDKKLRNTFQTLVHGDAKIENFCFSKDGVSIAAVDFQYVGGGCGMKDVAYFVSSCLRDAEAEQLENELLDFYFGKLIDAVTRRAISVDADVLVQEWRNLYPFAWADFHRFYKGWDSVHFSKTSYSERVTAAVIEAVNGGRRSDR